MIVAEKYKLYRGVNNETAVLVDDIFACPDCGGSLKHRDYTTRKWKTTEDDWEFIKTPRHKCTVCGKLHRILPEFLMPYKHYDKNVIEDVREGRLTCDYGELCVVTMKRWCR